MRTLLILLLFCLSAIAAPKLVIAPEIEAKPNSWARVTPDTNAKSVVYYAVDGPEPFPNEELKSPVKMIAYMPPDNGTEQRFRYIAVGCLADELTLTEFTIVVGKGKPKPNPKPDPQPDPQPPDQTGIVKYVVVIEETETAVPERAAFMFSPEIKSYFNSRLIIWRCADKDAVNAKGEPPADIARFIRDAKGKTLPMVYLVDDVGKTLASKPMPKTTKEFIAMLEKFK